MRMGDTSFLVKYLPKQIIRWPKKVWFGVGTVLFLTVIVLGAVVGRNLAAGSATLTLSPASGSFVLGNTFSVEVYENSGSTAINAVEADLNYDPSALQFVSADTTSSHSAFDIVVPSTGESGSIRVAVAKSGQAGLTDQQPVANVTFKVLVGQGYSSVTFASKSVIVSTDNVTNVWNGNTAGGSYSFAGNVSTLRTINIISSQVTSGGVQHVFTGTSSGNVYDTSWTGTGIPSTRQVGG